MTNTIEIRSYHLVCPSCNFDGMYYDHGTPRIFSDATAAITEFICYGCSKPIKVQITLAVGDKQVPVTPQKSK